MKQPVILIVDDFESIRKVIAQTLIRHGFEVKEARNGHHAVEVLQREPGIDLVLSDYNMPEMNGIELLKKVKGDVVFRKIPFVLLTSETSFEKKKLAKDLGLDAWVEKPYKIENFISLLTYTIEKARKYEGV